ncbi:MAG: hypothetical protein ABSG03_03980 [Bryobacteraceae bacterium]|jgi:hypothetical protein
MAETGIPTGAPESAPAQAGARSADEVALELTKFIAVTTGYGRGSQSSAGFSGKAGARSPEEQAEALLDLFVRCRRAVKQES